MTTPPQHTPGPWHLTHNIIPGQFGTEHKIRTLDGAVIAELWHEWEANARLIAAAPELLDALQRLLENPDSEGAWGLAHEAITKATGQTSA